MNIEDIDYTDAEQVNMINETKAAANNLDMVELVGKMVSEAMIYALRKMENLKKNNKDGKIVICTIADKDFLTPDEVEAYLKVSKNVIRDWEKGGLPYIQEKEKGRKFYEKEDLKEYLREYKRNEIKAYASRRK